MNRESVIRSARGYAPTTIQLKESLSSTLAVGAHLKNSIAISIDKNVFISQYIGDLSTQQAYSAFIKTIKSLSGIYEFGPEKVVSDLHPDYISTRYAEELSLPTQKVQHHHAHILSCMADNQLEPPVLGVSWDGTGLGTDDTIWGGEFLKVFRKTFIRVAHSRHFMLPGGEKAVEEPRRSAVGLLYEIFGEKLFTMPNIRPLYVFKSKERDVLKKMLKNNINSPATSSMGRLFDAVASIVGLCQIAGYEGHAAMQLEYAVSEITTDDSYSFDVEFQSLPYIINWERVIRSILDDVRNKVSVNMIAAKFHKALVELIISIASRVNDNNIVLSGGCFQNKYLLENTVQALQYSGFKPYWHRCVPTNDSGIALGQIMAVIHSKPKEK
jgi:hydrogenase maturation protein HypF